MLKYAFIDFLQDISKWLIIGLLIATAISVIVPDDFFTSYLGNDYLQMFVVLLASIPLYVCATASVPIAAVLMLKGVSAGAILVFLMAGPATNAATISIITKVLGKKTLFYYLFSIITGALIFGFIVNFFFPNDFLFKEALDLYGGHEHHLLPQWVKTASGITLILLIANGYIQKLISRKKQLIKTQNTNHTNQSKMSYLTIKIEGMTCNHCKTTVESHLGSLSGINEVNVDLTASTASLKGESIDLDKVLTFSEGYLQMSRIEFPDKPVFNQQVIVFGKDEPAVRELMDRIQLDSIIRVKSPVHIAGLDDFLSVDFSQMSSYSSRDSDLIAQHREFSQILDTFKI